VVEFFVDLGEIRPEVKLMDMVRAWLANEPPSTPHCMMWSYHQPVGEDQPSILMGTLIMGEPIDLG
jgi:hypothetical protein